MDKTTRTYKLHRLLHGRRTVVTLQKIMEELDCSRATANRVIKEMREEFQAPIEYDYEREGYLYVKTDGKTFDLPGVWFSESELLALLSMDALLCQMGNTYLSRLLAPARDQVRSMLGTDDSNLTDRLQIIEHMQRTNHYEAFEPVLSGLMQKKQLKVTYHTRGKDERSERVLSPVRMTHFKSNWYLDAWCHKRNGLRRFALDAIEAATLLDEPAVSVPQELILNSLDSDYGAFAGTADKTAILVFEADDAKWVSKEKWHPGQEGRWLEGGKYELRVPYANDRELIMDILRFGPGVEVMEPKPLRDKVVQQIEAALHKYR